MLTVNIENPNPDLSRFVQALESGRAAEGILSIDGRPAVRVLRLEGGAPRKKPLLGSAKGKFVVPDNIDELNPEIEKLFNGEAD